MNADVNYPRPDIPKTLQKIHEEMTARVTEACKTFVIATTDVIPVLTGGTKATFLKLATQARVALEITHKKGDRVALGIESSTGELFLEKGERYGFSWSSDLYYIGYVHARVSPFLDVGLAAIEKLNVGLPAPEIKSSK